ncbi:unnamed protein product [Linum trigynum]|uniref:Uncharacterized protein n=1 Tax=Linum trigynum TaxID=586398 RepID=A0AAV2DVX9_9ROSI
MTRKEQGNEAADYGRNRMEAERWRGIQSQRTKARSRSGGGVGIGHGEGLGHAWFHPTPLLDASIGIP